LHEFKCDSFDEGWNFGSDPYIHHAVYSWDSVVKKEGANSIHFSENRSDPYTPGEGSRENLASVAITPVSEMRIHCWHKVSMMTQLTHNEVGVFYLGPGGFYPAFDVTGVEDWTFKKATLTDLPSPQDGMYFYWANWCYLSGPLVAHSYLDHIVLSKSQYLKVSGLVPGQKVEVYRASDNVKIAEATCASGQSSITVDIDAEEYPEYMYLKIYASDGTTLVETTPSYKISGGDEWAWTSPAGTLSASGTPYIFYREDAIAAPKSSAITATLKTEAGQPAPGKVVYFSTTLGTVDPASDTTDANGEAHTTLTSNIQGIASVKCNWPGDADIPAAVAYSKHHVFYDAEEGNPDKNFQFYIEGKEFPYVSGHYALSTDTTPQEFSVEIPEWDDGIVPRGLVSIYRLGTLEYSGILTKPHRDLSESPKVTLGGTDSKSLLEEVVVTLSDYSEKTLTEIIAGLLTAYPSAVSLGNVEPYPTPLSITFADEYLVSSVSRLVNLIGWFYRVTADRKLDLESAFGVTKPNIMFIEGVNLFRVDHDEDYSQVANRVRLRGSSTLVSTVFDDASIGDVGLLDGIAFQKTITSQAMLDIAACAELARTMGAATKISGDVLDDYDPMSWLVGDWVTITSDYVDLSDSFKIVQIQRDMVDPSFAHVECVNKRAYELADIFEKLSRQLKDLNVS